VSNKSNKNNTGDQIVGVFLDESHAQAAIQALKSMGGNARIADEQAISAFRATGLEDEAIDLYRSRMSEGNTVVVANGAGQGDQALATMLQYGAEFINLKSQGQSTTGSQDARYYQNLDLNRRQYGTEVQGGQRRNADQMRLQLREETLTATKQAVQAGEVEVRKVVHERQEQIPVNLTHEEVYVERHAVDRPVAPGEINDMQDEVIRVPVYEEQAQLQKQARVREEVEIGKRGVQEQQTLTGTTRHEHAEVVQTGDVEVRDSQQANTGTTGTTNEGYTTDTNQNRGTDARS